MPSAKTSKAKAVLIAVALWAAAFPADGQTSKGPDEPLDWWGDMDGFVNRQHHHTLSLVDEALDAFPPKIDEPLERRMALLMIDNVMHEENAAKRPAVHAFLHRRIAGVLQALEQTNVTDGARVWKLYNHGFIVRTSTVTVAFDLVRGRSARAEGFALADETMQAIIRQCDVLFISHRHGDHADEFVAQTFIDQEKPAVAPPEIWDGKPIHNSMTHLERETGLVQELALRGGQATLRVINYPGHQGRNIQNNVPLVMTPEGLSFIQTGDQSNEDDFQWLDTIGKDHSVDILFPNCWTPNITRMIAGVAPALVVTGHENEMGHTIDHREPHWLTYVRLAETKTPCIVMTWGEEFHYRVKID